MSEEEQEPEPEPEMGADINYEPYQNPDYYYLPIKTRPAR